MKVRTALSLALLATALAIVPAPTLAVDSDPSPPVNNDHAAGKKAIEAKDWNGAIKSLTAAAQRDSRNADIQNLLGYAYRNAGQLDPAFKHYQRALPGRQEIAGLRRAGLLGGLFIGSTGCGIR